jgi:hypothetical protein
MLYPLDLQDDAPCRIDTRDEERIVKTSIQFRCLPFLATAALAAGAAIADDIRPDSLRQDARPFASEKCIEQCDTESDRCMADSQGDPDKLQACDEKYSACLQACEGAG